MTEQLEGKKSRPRSRAEADALAAEYEASGLSRQEFCRQRNVAFKTLARYIVQRRKRARAAPSSGSSRLVRVQVEPPPESARELTVTLAGGRRIAVKPGFDAALLRQLLTVLEQS
jgi:hypothetical protein